MVKEIVVILDTGIPLYHYDVTGERKLDELVSGFLSAMGSFAEEVSGEKVKVISFAENKFVWVKKGNLIFIALISQNDSAEIYRVILQDLSEQFVGMYYEELMKEWQEFRIFRNFSEFVELTLQRFDGIPGLARRYKTALLPVDDLDALKIQLVELEEDKHILRGAAITWDGYILLSTLRTYELEAILDLLTTIKRDSKDTENGIIVVHTSLDPVTEFFVVALSEKGFCPFVVNKGLTNEEYYIIVNPFLSLLSKTSFENIKFVLPTHAAETFTFYDYDLIIPTRPVKEIVSEAHVIMSGMNEERMEQAIEILSSLKQITTIAEIQDISRLDKEIINEILAFLIAKELIVISKIFPVMASRDERFAAYLELIGIPKKDYDIVDSIWEFCNGSFSIREISTKSKVPASRIIEVLRTLGNHVKWEKERVLSRVG